MYICLWWPKLEKELEDEEVWDDTINPKDHLESQHLVNHVGGQHLDATPIAMEELLLKVSQREAETSVKHFQVNVDLPKRRRSGHDTRSRELHSVSRRQTVRFLQGLELRMIWNKTRRSRHSRKLPEKEKEDEVQKKKSRKGGRVFPRYKEGDKRQDFSKP